MILIFLISIIIYNRSTYSFTRITTEKSDLQYSNIEPTPNNTKEVTFLLNDDTPYLSGLSNADIIFEYLGPENQTIYKAIYNENTDLKTTEIVSVSNTKDNYINNLKFCNKKLRTLGSKTANAIFVSFDLYSSSNFVYKNGQYYHYKNKNKDIDNSNNQSVKVSNIIVQYINEKNVNKSIQDISGSGNGLIFSSGKATKINWSKSKDNPIKLTDTKGNELSLNKGQTWYIIINKNSSVAYN